MVCINLGCAGFYFCLNFKFLIRWDFHSGVWLEVALELDLRNNYCTSHVVISFFIYSLVWQSVRNREGIAPWLRLVAVRFDLHRMMA